MAQERGVWNYNSDNFLLIGATPDEALYLVISTAYPEDATVTYTLKDRYGANVTGYVDQALAHVAGTTGSGTQYFLKVEKTTPPLPIGHYTAVVTATKSGIDGQAFKPITVRRG